MLPLCCATCYRNRSIAHETCASSVGNTVTLLFPEKIYAWNVTQIQFCISIFFSAFLRVWHGLVL